MNLGSLNATTGQSAVPEELRTSQDFLRQNQAVPEGLRTSQDWLRQMATEPQLSIAPSSIGEAMFMAPTGQSAVPPGSPLAPNPAEQQPVGIMHSGGVVPQTGPYILQAGETVIPNPAMLHGAEPGPAYPEGRFYLNPKRGVPYEAKKNPDGRDWRLIFNPADYYDAWQKRAKDGPPLLVPPSVLERPDWPTVVQAAQATQYQAVHPAILLARSQPGYLLRPEPGDPRYPHPEIDNPWMVMREPQGVLGGRPDDAPPLMDGERTEPWFLRTEPGPVPVPETTPPIRTMPRGRPMTPKELKELQEDDERDAMMETT